MPAARTFVGLGLLLTGFLVQIGGYVVDGSSWLALLGAAVIVGGILCGRLLAERLLASWLFRRAIRFRGAQETTNAS